MITDTNILRHHRVDYGPRLGSAAPRKPRKQLLAVLIVFCLPVLVHVMSLPL